LVSDLRLLKKKRVMQIIVFIAALLASALLTRCIRDLCIARGWVSKPTSDRHVHTRPIPRLGGVAIFTTLWSLVLFAWAAGRFTGHEPIFPYLTFKILGPATIIFVLGLIDDFYGVSAYVKFAVQAGAAVVLFLNGFGISRLSLMAGHPHLNWLIGLPLTVLWVLWITNAFNLIDGLDGLAAGCALFSTLVICVTANIFHNQGILLLTLALAGAIAGFLRFNFNPASIFLGDCGSLLIGFLLSAIAMAGSQKAPTVVAVAIPIVSLGLPILDVTVAVFRRFLSCRRLFDPDREHIHHKLLGRGISHRDAVLVLYAVSACFGLLSLFLLHPASAAVILVLTAVGFGVVVGVQQLRYQEFLELGRAANRTLNLRHVISNDIRIRRASDALRSCTTLQQFCQIMQQCLKPAGFDGFGLYFSSELPLQAEALPLPHPRGSKVRFFWDRSLKISEPNWSLSLNLEKHNGARLGCLTLYRKDAKTPLCVDMDIFTSTGFSSAVARIVEKMRDSWFVEPHKKAPGIPVLEATSPVIGHRMRQTITVPSSL
jgi:UDP-GlcNAc:undecaprenyl-phosphate GlcNAc-1-phosphate transferase